MKADEVHSTRWEDIVFENRNKVYGAYLIRNIYAKHVVIASLITILLVSFILAFPAIAAFFKSQKDTEEVELKSVKYTDLAPPPPIDKNTPPPPKLDVPPPVKTIIKFLPPKVTDKEIVEEEKMPTIEEVKQNDTGAETIEAEYPGGLEAMMKFLRKNMKYPAVARRMGVEGAVYVSFVIDREGNISDIQIVKGISAECDKEALRVVKLMPLWKPGKQNGKAVRSRFVLPIKFRLAV